MGDSAGNLWIGTHSRGLDKFNRSDESFTHYTHNPDDPGSISSDFLINLYNNSGILWIGTKEIGLIKYDPDEGLKKTYTTNDGLPLNYISGILEDDHGNLWVSTGVGVSKFNPLTETIKNYNYEDGLQGIGEMTPCKSKTGEMIFGNSWGLSIFHPDSIRDYNHIPLVYFTDLYLFNKKVPIGYDS